MADILHRIGIRQTPDRIYNAITTKEGLSNWWTEAVTGSEEAGGTLRFAFCSPQGEHIGQMDMLVTKCEPGKQLVWQCVGGPEDWVGTEIHFDLCDVDGMVILLFSHKGWRTASESMAHCSTKWAVFLLSLRDYLQTGEGCPSPRDLKIDNWN